VFLYTAPAINTGYGRGLSNKVYHKFLSKFFYQGQASCNYTLQYVAFYLLHITNKMKHLLLWTCPTGVKAFAGWLAVTVSAQKTLKNYGRSFLCLKIKCIVAAKCS